MVYFRRNRRCCSKGDLEADLELSSDDAGSAVNLHWRHTELGQPDWRDWINVLFRGYGLKREYYVVEC